jgi:hypothetical protein
MHVLNDPQHRLLIPNGLLGNRGPSGHSAGEGLCIDAEQNILLSKYQFPMTETQCY